MRSANGVLIQAHIAGGVLSLGTGKGSLGDRHGRAGGRNRGCTAQDGAGIGAVQADRKGLI